AAERADALVGIGNLARSLEDAATEQRAREGAVAAFREAGDDRDTLVQLSVALHNLALFYINQEDYDAAIPLLEEVVALLDAQSAHPDLESDRAALEHMRRRAAGEPEPGMREAVAAWVEGGRNEEQFAALLNGICNLYVQVMTTGSREQQAELAHDLAYVRAARPLPIAGSNDFLFILQLLLRGEPEMVARAIQQRAALPAPLANALNIMERLISGEAAPPQPEEPAQQAEMAAAAEALLGQLSPEQRAELMVAAQIVPYLQQALSVLRNPEIPVTERARLAEGLDHVAAQAAADEEEGSPWLIAASTLRVVAGWLRGTPPNAAALPEPYRGLIHTLMEETTDE
ncbi:MAG: tetratricopeptide repeat protein, partial [Chloroflexaceae bacterium]|nr:tetratricopeptide repeat protein [Chloroflexaceae bacterium]